jgi:hypothetical protein
MARARTEPKVDVRQQLDAVVARFPALAALRGELGPDDRISTEFL